jgi:hypothetical protein
LQKLCNRIANTERQIVLTLRNRIANAAQILRNATESLRDVQAMSTLCTSLRNLAQINTADRI